MAPEMLNFGSKFDYRVDIWSLGVVLFQLCELSGSPFTASVEQRLVYKIRNVQHLPINKNYYSNDVCNVYEACMNKDLRTRPTAKQLLALKEIQDWAKEVGVVSPQLNSACRMTDCPSLEEFVEATKTSVANRKPNELTKSKAGPNAERPPAPSLSNQV